MVRKRKCQDFVKLFSLRIRSIFLLFFTEHGMIIYMQSAKILVKYALPVRSRRIFFKSDLSDFLISAGLALFEKTEIINEKKQL